LNRGFQGLLWPATIAWWWPMTRLPANIQNGWENRFDGRM